MCGLSTKFSTMLFVMAREALMRLSQLLQYQAPYYESVFLSNVLGQEVAMRYYRWCDYLRCNALFVISTTQFSNSFCYVSLYQHTHHF